MSKVISKSEAVSYIKDGSIVMFGGFLGCGSAESLIDIIVDNKTKDLTLIANDTAFVDRSYGKLIVNKQVKKAIVCHIGTNKETGRQMQAGELAVELCPMGSFVERIRACGSGLGGVLTPTGIGTMVSEGKQVITLQGKEYLLEEALGADVAVIYATTADKYGNLKYHGTTRNFNVVMATAANTTIVEVDEIVDMIDPDEVVIPGIFVNYIVKGGK